MKPRTQNEAARLAAEEVELDEANEIAESIASEEKIDLLCAKYFPKK